MAAGMRGWLSPLMATSCSRNGPAVHCAQHPATAGLAGGACAPWALTDARDWSSFLRQSVSLRFHSFSALMDASCTSPLGVVVAALTSQRTTMSMPFLSSHLR